MTLPTPILDDRSYEQIREELVRRIPVYNPEWTDFNASDPGITLIELMSFLSENLLFRFNQIPDATFLAFLNLLQIGLRPARAAEGIVALSARRVQDGPLAAGAEVAAGDVPFATLREVDVLPLEVLALMKRVTAPPADEDEAEFVQQILDARPPAANESYAYYRTVRLAAKPGDPGDRTLDLRRSVDGALWIAVLRTRHTDIEQLDGRILNLGFSSEGEPALIEEGYSGPGGGERREPGPPVHWEATRAGHHGPTGEPVFRPLALIADSTAGLTREGVIRLELTDPISDLGVPQPPAGQEARLGSGDYPPELEDPAEQERVIFWVRATRRRPEDPRPHFRWVGVNATEVKQLRTARPEFLGTGTGQPDQQVVLIHTPVLPGSLRLEVEEGQESRAAGRSVWVEWTEETGFQASRPDSRHFTLDSQSGAVTFGNSKRGRPPQPGERIRAMTYTYGGGARGNVPAGAISKVVGETGITVENPLPTRYGDEGEPLQEALDRIPGELRRRGRAVTAGDFRELALQTPGGLVGRAEVLPLYDPRSEEEESAGVVSVVIWPREDPRHPGAPLPDRALVREVCRWLDRHRLVTTDLWVIPPIYRKIAVSVGLEIRDDAGVAAVRRWAEVAIRQFLAPLPPYGPDGGGWPLGRRVHGPELEAAVLQVEGVSFLVDRIRLAVWDDESQQWTEVTTGTIQLDITEVPEVWEVSVVEGTPLEPGQAIGRAIPPPISEAILDEVMSPPVSTDPLPPGSAPSPATPPEAPGPVPVPVAIPLPRLEC